ncbi:hypothetical protein BN1013_01353 [Candidatus Rubidus massiliensis]|nr:MAG: hypothetical protein BGO10_04155 [Chlamydia sp. 32-24]CDZ80830.1 hypothetical protein BN1013_01353 [Candidatus Rubidus massiliensis]
MTKIYNAGEKVLQGFEAVPFLGIAPGLVELIYRIIDVFKNLHEYLEAKKGNSDQKNHHITHIKSKEVIETNDEVADLLSNDSDLDIEPWDRVNDEAYKQSPSGIIPDSGIHADILSKEEKQQNLKEELNESLTKLGHTAIRIIPFVGMGFTIHQHNKNKFQKVTIKPKVKVTGN